MCDGENRQTEDSYEMQVDVVSKSPKSSKQDASAHQETPPRLNNEKQEVDQGNSTETG